MDSRCADAPSDLRGQMTKTSLHLEREIKSDPRGMTRRGGAHLAIARSACRAGQGRMPRFMGLHMVSAWGGYRFGAAAAEDAGFSAVAVLTLALGIGATPRFFQRPRRAAPVAAVRTAIG